MITHAIDCDLDDDCVCGAAYYAEATMADSPDTSAPTTPAAAPADPPPPPPAPEPSIVDLANACLAAQKAHADALAKSNASQAQAAADQKAESDALQAFNKTKQDIEHAVDALT